MSPYTYRRRKAAPASFLDRAVSLYNAVLEARISTAIAMAAVILAAGSGLAVTAMASPEIAMGDQPASSMARLAAVYPHAQVLGDSTSIIDDSALEAGDPTGDLSAKPLSFDSVLGRWDYTVTYKVNNLNGSASLYIGTYAVQSSITSSGSTETGSILKPGAHYVASLWAIDSTGAKVRLAKIDIKTPKAKTSSSGGYSDVGKCSPPAQPDSSVSGTTATSAPASGLSLPNFCIRDNNGKIHCQRPRCTEPVPMEGTNASGTPSFLHASGTPPTATGGMPPLRGRPQSQSGSASQ